MLIFPTDEGDINSVPPFNNGATLILIQMLGLVLNFILEKDSEQTSKSRSGWKCNVFNAWEQTFSHK